MHEEPYPTTKINMHTNIYLFYFPNLINLNQFKSTHCNYLMSKLQNIEIKQYINLYALIFRYGYNIILLQINITYCK